MDSLFSGPFGIVLILVAFVVFAGLFWDLLGDDIRESGWGGRAFRPSRRRSATQRPARPSQGFSEAGSSAPPPGGRESLQFSRTVETWIDGETGEIRGRVLAGAYHGRGLETLSRTDCLRLNEYCLRGDPEAARLLGVYLLARFGGGPRAKASRGEDRRQAAVEGAMTRQNAYAILGLADAANEREIVKAHRALIKKHHPDHGGSTADAARINQAKDFLLAKRT